MNLADAARHHLFVNGLGKAALRFERLRLERQKHSNQQSVADRVSLAIGRSSRCACH